MFFMQLMLYFAVAYLDLICFLRFRHLSNHAPRYFITGLQTILASVTIMAFVVHLAICLVDAKIMNSLWSHSSLNRLSPSRF